MHFTRYALYYTPEPGPLAAFGAAWLGWDPVAGRELPAPRVAHLPQPVRKLTATPRKYGFHATLKPPFALAPGMTAEALTDAVGHFATTRPTVEASGLKLATLGRFLALVPDGDDAAIAALAAACVTTFDRFRALPPDAELARRRARGLSPREEANLVAWGYPYVIDTFRFHMTLTGSLSPADADATRAALTPAITPLLPATFRITSLTLAGEDASGRFHEVSRFPLTG